MLKLYVSAKDSYNDSKNEFITTQPCVLNLEHSLVSISKWESKFHKSFLDSAQKTQEELLYYIKCMTLTQNVDENVFLTLSVDEVKQINDYIGDPRTATTFYNRRNDANLPKKEIITSELIYYWMIAFEIPFECEKWHLNRLMTLIKICNIKNDTGKNSKMSNNATLRSNSALNAARRKAMNSKG